MLKQGNTEKIIKHRFPEPVALIVCQNSKGKINLCPIGFFTLVAWEPKVWAIGLDKTHYSTKVISETNEFVLCLPSIDQVKDVLYMGSVHGWNTDKTNNIAIKFKKSKLVKPPLVDDAIANFECKVIKKLKIKDHLVFFGEIVKSYESDKNWQDKIYNWDDKNLGTLKLGNRPMKILYSPEE